MKTWKTKQCGTPDLSLTLNSIESGGGVVFSIIFEGVDAFGHFYRIVYYTEASLNRDAK